MRGPPGECGRALFDAETRGDMKGVCVGLIFNICELGCVHGTAVETRASRLRPSGGQHLAD